MFQKALEVLVNFLCDFVLAHPRIVCSVVGVLGALALIACVVCFNILS